MFDKLAAIAGRYTELDRLLSDPDTLSDYEKIAEYSKERSGLTEIVEAYQQYRRDADELEGARAMLMDEADPDLHAMAQEEVARLEGSLPTVEAELKDMLLPNDPRGH